MMMVGLYLKESTSQCTYFSSHSVVSVGFDPTSYTVLEGGSTDLIIVKNGDTEGPLLVTVSTNDGTATGDSTIMFYSRVNKN